MQEIKGLTKALQHTEQALKEAHATSEHHQHRGEDLEQQLHTMAKVNADLAALKSKLLAQGNLTQVTTLHAA